MQNRANFEDFDISEEDAKKYIRLGISKELQFEVMNIQMSQYQVLNERQINELYSNHPQKKPIRLKDSSYNESLHRIEEFSYEQEIDYKDLWFDSTKFIEILKNPSHFQKKKIEESKPNLQDSPYWRALQKLTIDAIEKYPGWRKAQRSVRIENLLDWLKTIGAKSREADVIKKILSDFHEELN